MGYARAEAAGAREHSPDEDETDGKAACRFRRDREKMRRTEIAWRIVCRDIIS
jgi:hypothetical protein